MSGTDLGSRVAVLEERWTRIEAKLDKTCHIITGNGEPEKGLVQKVSNLEALAAAMKTLMKWLLGMGGTVLAGLVLNLILQFSGR